MADEEKNVRCKDDDDPNDREVRRVRPDLCMDDRSPDRNENNAQALPLPEEIPRRDENPFSFKRFLNQDSRAGARRKEYPPGPVLHAPEMSSVLPDFVQDHLVVEQCFMPSSQQHGPFELPRPAEERTMDPSVALSLPDFLSDGPIHSQRCEGDLEGYLSSEPSTSNGSHSTPSFSRDFQHESDRLHREVTNLRQQLQEKTRRTHVLESELCSLRSSEARHSASLQQALEQVESNLKQTSERLAASENTIMTLKAENKRLRERLETNGTKLSAGLSTASLRLSHNPMTQELTEAADAAEVHLRALIANIGNMRLLASRLGGLGASDLGAGEKVQDTADSDNDGEGGTRP